MSSVTLVFGESPGPIIAIPIITIESKDYAFPESIPVIRQMMESAEKRQILGGLGHVGYWFVNTRDEDERIRVLNSFFDDIVGVYRGSSDGEVRSSALITMGGIASGDHRRVLDFLLREADAGTTFMDRFTASYVLSVWVAPEEGIPRLLPLTARVNEQDHYTPDGMLDAAYDALEKITEGRFKDLPRFEASDPKEVRDSAVAHYMDWWDKGGRSESLRTIPK